jgi:replication factor C large subunit
MADWTETYRPTTLAEVRGNNKARDALEEWADTWDDHGEAVILYGSPGVGKTSAAHALANDKGWPVIELNASDKRTADAIERYAGRGARNNTLAGSVERARRSEAGEEQTGDEGRQLIVVDEADSIHYHKDSGGTRAITDLVKEAGQPMVLVANDYYEMSRGLRNACREIEFRDVSARSIVPVLRDICRQEDIAFDEDALREIAEQNSGDLRGAVKDLQSIADGKERIDVEDVSAGRRDTTEDIFAFLDAVLKEKSAEDALHTTYDVDETPDDLLLWIEDKVPKVYDPDELARAYRHVAKADRWLGRVRATQDYSYWRYVTDNVAAGVAVARSETRGGWTRYGGAPYRSSKDSTRDYVAQKIAETAGVSTGTARREIMPFLAAMTHHCTNRDLTVRMAARYDLDAGHVSFITGSGETTNKVQSIVEDAEELREQEAVEHAGDAFLERAGSDADGDGASSESGTADGMAADSTADGDGAASDDDGRMTLDADDEDGSEPDEGGAGADADDGEGDPEDAEEAEEDDQQTGLGDFA